MDDTERYTCTICGDGAGAALLVCSDGVYVHKNGCDGNAEVLSCMGVGSEDMHIHMKGNEVFKFAVTALKASIDQVLEEMGSTLEEVDYVICHQANARIIDHVKKKYPGHEEKFYLNLMKYGNTSAASIPIAIHELMESGKLREGMKIICVGFGAGLTWGGTYLQV